MAMSLSASLYEYEFKPHIFEIAFYASARASFTA